MEKPQGRYVYAISYSGPSPDLSGLPGVAVIGADPAPVEVHAEGPVAAIVSPFAGRQVRPERRNLAAHNGVLRTLMTARVPFLPVAFGCVAPSRNKLSRMLDAARDEVLADLERLAGRVEMGLKVVWDVPNIFDYFVFHYPELAELRDRLQRKRGGPTRDDQIQLGRTFETLLQETRARHVASVQQALRDCVREFRDDPPRDEKMVMNLSCLVDREGEKEFAQSVIHAAALFDDHYTFDYNGPWPPYHFVAATLEEPVAETVRGRE